MFTLHPKLAEDTMTIGRLPVSRLLLMDNAYFPWLILVPECENAVELTDIAKEKRVALMEEIMEVSEWFKQLTGADKMNIATLGNQVPQLHIHVIARFKKDAAWPDPVWGGVRRRYDEERKAEWMSRLRSLPNITVASNSA